MRSIFSDQVIQNKIWYYTPDEVFKKGKDNFVFKFIIAICWLLKIDIPNVSLNFINYDNEETAGVTSITWLPDEHPDLDKPLVYMTFQEPLDDESQEATMEMFDILGCIAYELRYLWQKKYYPEKYSEEAHSLLDFLYNPSDVDADAFAIVMLSNELSIDLEMAGMAFCPREFKQFPSALSRRVERAREIINDLKRAK